MPRHPTSLRLPDDVRERLDRASDRLREPASAVAVRLIDEGLRMQEHPAVAFHDSPAHGRVAAVSGGPDIAEVIDVLTGLDAEGDERIDETAAWLGIHASQVRAALAYYTAFREEIDRQLARRRREAAELRARYDAERALLE
jgi:hypothetical protein